MPLSITSKLQVLARECNTSGLITSECNQSQLLPNRQAPRFLTGFADAQGNAPFHEVFRAPFGISILTIQLTVAWPAVPHLHTSNIEPWHPKVSPSHLAQASYHRY